MDNLQEIRTCATSLGLIHTKNELETWIHTAETEESSYVTLSSFKIVLMIKIIMEAAKDSLFLMKN